jgi:hypothetical protein
MHTSFCPRLSEAKTLLPWLRAQLIAAAPRYALPINVSLDLLPIVEDGLFGYELVPDRHTHTYLAIGFCETGDAILRRTLFGTDAPGALRLATMDGELLSRSNFKSLKFPQERDYRFADISVAVDSGLSHLVTIFPGTPRQPMTFQVGWHRCLDEALEIAHEHLSAWNPFIHFFGVPLEAQFGFALRGAHGELGELVSRRPDMWVLRWKSRQAIIYEEWAVTPSAPDVAGGLVQA